MAKKKKKKENKGLKVKKVIRPSKQITIDLRKKEPIPEKKIFFKGEEIGTRSSLFA